MKIYSKLLLTTALLLAAIIPTSAQVQSTYVPLTGEAADRLAIKDLIDAYGHDADRREAEKQASLFTPDAILENIHTEPGKEKETTMLRGHKELVAGFETLKKFEVTMHVNGQSTIEIHGDTATGETYCLAHHIYIDKGRRLLMIMGIRYYDTIVRVNGHWLFAKRQLNFDWVDRRPLNP
jgi:SnoaL-like domain